MTDLRYAFAKAYDYIFAFGVSAFFALVIGYVLISGMETIAAGMG